MVKLYYSLNFTPWAIVKVDGTHEIILSVAGIGSIFSGYGTTLYCTLYSVTEVQRVNIT